VINVNRQSIPSIELIGKNKTPVIIIDNYADNLDEIIEQVVSNSLFNPDEVTSYPGVRSPIPKDLVVNYLKPLIQVIYGIYKFSDSLQPSPKDNYFSLTATQPNELLSIQTWPHFDTTNPNLIAVIHYLGKGEHGGTGFFTHKKSGLERIEQKNKHYFYQCASEFFHDENNKGLGYCQEQHSEFSCYKKIAYKPNRLIIFPGQLLHSTLVDLNTDIELNPASGRLTANMFVAFK
jgi:hypothetical protein